MCNAHEILWRVSWYTKAAKKNMVSVVLYVSMWIIIYAKISLFGL
jgi:hypothetical protein